MIETAGQISDFVFRWCGIWLVMNGITAAAHKVRRYVMWRRMNKFLDNIFCNVSGDDGASVERTVEKEPKTEEDMENAGEDPDDPEKRENAVPAE